MDDENARVVSADAEVSASCLWLLCQPHSEDWLQVTREAFLQVSSTRLAVSFLSEPLPWQGDRFRHLGSLVLLVLEVGLEVGRKVAWMALDGAQQRVLPAQKAS